MCMNHVRGNDVCIYRYTTASLTLCLSAKKHRRLDGIELCQGYTLCQFFLRCLYLGLTF